MIKFDNGVDAWKLSAVDIMHFDGECKKPQPILKAMRKWLNETNAAPSHIRIDCIYNTDSGEWEYTGSIEWDSTFRD